MNYVTSIGREVHVQLKTRSKMFCRCAVEFAAEPNSLTCPTCLGLPGTLPVMNQQALRLTTLTGLMLGCEIAAICRFARKNYSYPDMPKNHQISQYETPLCANGGVPLHIFAYPKDAQKNLTDPEKEVRLVRMPTCAGRARSTGQVDRRGKNQQPAREGSFRRDVYQRPTGESDRAAERRRAVERQRGNRGTLRSGDRSPTETSGGLPRRPCGFA